MGGLPDILFVIDTNKEAIAVAEANKLGIPVVAVLDSNSDPDGIDFPIPGNDDALRAISLYCDLVVDAVLDGIQPEMVGLRRRSRRAEAEPTRGACRRGAGRSATRRGGRAADEPRRQRPSPAEDAGRSDAAEQPDRRSARRPAGVRANQAERATCGRRRGRNLERAARWPRSRASLVKELREKTGAGMMDCKKALTETGGDLEAAVDWLRKKGLAAAAKKAGRVAAEGLIGVAVDGTPRRRGRGQFRDRLRRPQRDFQEFVGHRRPASRSAPTATSTALDRRSAYPGSGRTVADELTHLIATIGENMTLRRDRVARASSRASSRSYVHNAQGAGLGKHRRAGRARSRPDRAGGRRARQAARHARRRRQPAGGLARRLSTRRRSSASARCCASRRARRASPRRSSHKMVEGRLRKFYEEVVLLEQAFVIDGRRKVKAVVEAAGKDSAAGRGQRLRPLRAGRGHRKATRTDEAAAA